MMNELFQSDDCSQILVPVSLSVIAALCASIFLIQTIGSLFCCLFTEKEERKLSRKNLKKPKRQENNYSGVDSQGYRETDFSIISTRFAAKRSYIKEPPFAEDVIF